MMSTFFSIFITVIVVVCLVGWAILLTWCTKDNLGVEDNADMGHEYDGIRELNTPLPKWWSYMFWATLVFAVGYLIVYPGLGNYKGLLGWTSSNQNIQTLAESKAAIIADQKNKRFDQYAIELAQADQTFDPVLKKAIYQADGKTYQSIEQIAKNPDALAIGQNLFLQNCSQCHGASARGQFGFPNLTDKDWLYGGSPDRIKETIMKGRSGKMAAWSSLGEDAVKNLAAYVLTLSGRTGIDTAQVAKGKQMFLACSACHGPDGKGSNNLAISTKNPAIADIGAPNLTDNIWLYAGDRATVEETIRNGRNGVMPAWGTILGEDKVQLLTAYVWSLSNDSTTK